MAKKLKGNTVFQMQFGQAVDPKEFAREIVEAFPVEGGFQKLAEKTPVRVSLGTRFPDADSKVRVLSEAVKVKLSLPDRLSFYEQDDVDAKTTAYLMEGTLAACLDTSSQVLASLGSGASLLKTFQRANKGKTIHPEIIAFYQWMDAQLNGNLKPPTNS